MNFIFTRFFVSKYFSDGFQLRLFTLFLRGRLKFITLAGFKENEFCFLQLIKSGGRVIGRL